jgi:molecular chaperone HtpG
VPRRHRQYVTGTSTNTIGAMQTKIPPRLRALLDESDCAGAIIGFVECCDQILGQNQMPFFPAYTDHGTSHVGLVLEATERLVPAEAWQKELLTADDGAVLVAAVFLHDLGMHLSEAGFLALVAEGTAHRPLPWFDKRQPGREPDVPWPQLWQDFRRQARRLSRSQLDRILGPDAEDLPRIVLGDFDERPGDWTLDDRLIVGEFLRRHHARMAHEIAAYGMPGVPASEFPILARTAPALAEAIGATARSHHEDLRSAAAYLDTRSKGDLRPDGVAQLYLMGLLRIADYFQLDAKRATPLLLHLRDPQSPASVEEWHRHQAIASISWDHRDPHAATVQVSPSHGLRTHIQLGELLAGLQAELDLTAAVLSETYGSSRLSPLALTLQRVKTNLHDEDLHSRLRYVPRQARMRSAEDLFRLVVADLYGNEPAVAGRELLQNAVDAVRERERWESRRGETLEKERFRPQNADVVVEARELDDRIGLLRVSDRGIGMTVDTVIESFLTAGATFSPASMEPDADEDPTLARIKAGRFGIGIFAAYLLGDMIEVTTRHPADARGITFFALMSEDLVELRWADDAPLGTEVVAPFAFDRLGRLPAGW